MSRVRGARGRARSVRGRVAEITAIGSQLNSSPTLGTAVNGVLSTTQSGRSEQVPEHREQHRDAEHRPGDGRRGARQPGGTELHEGDDQQHGRPVGERGQGEPPPWSGSSTEAPKLAPIAHPLSARSSRETTAGTTSRESAQRIREIAPDHCSSVRPVDSSLRTASALCRANAETSSTFAIAKKPSSPTRASWESPRKASLIGLSPESRSAITVATVP